MIILAAADVTRLLDTQTCIEAVESAFRALGDPTRAQSGVLGLHVLDGGFHVKAATLRDGERSWYVAKINANFPRNPRANGLPTIQGVLALFDATVGTPLAIMDSAALTAIRTAAATGVAARHLAREDACVLAVIGCGAQAAAQIDAVRCVRPVRTVRLFDADPSAAVRLAAAISGVDVEISHSLENATRGAHIVVTCTSSRSPFLRREHVDDEAFVAAVGSDDEDKSEIDPSLMRDAAVVVDSLEQCACIGDLHHAIAAGVMTRADVHADLHTVVSGSAGAHTKAVTIFDSTGVAIQDVVAARLVYLRHTEALAS